MIRSSIAFSLLLTSICAPASSACAQMQPLPTGAVDPARTASLQPAPRNRTTAEFIWTANDAAARDPKLQASVRGQDQKIEPHFFRIHFRVETAPPAATLYIAGPRSVTAFLNGVEVLRAEDDGTRPKNLSVIMTDVHAALHAGDNVLAIQEVRGHSSLHTGANATINQITYGEVLAAEILPARAGVEASALVATNSQWRSTLQAAGEWQRPDFDDSGWQRAESLGVLGSKQDFLQWNADAGLYAWPGYKGIGPQLRVFTIEPMRKENFAGGLLLDFGREISGRLSVHSRASSDDELTVSYGESREEAMKGAAYLGVRRLLVPAGETVFGPKSAFRYALVTLPAGTDRNPLQIAAQAITYPVEYEGSFESSDPLLNRIWETAAYTARLCMQEGIWDAPKRDRGRWMGDLDVTGRTITAIFGERALMEATMHDVIGEPPVMRHVNTIAGYSALWVTGMANFYRHTGDRAYLESQRVQLVSLLELMGRELDPQSGLFVAAGHPKIFVDWSQGFSTDTPEARAATHFEYELAFREAAFLFRELNDSVRAQQYTRLAEKLRTAAEAHLRSADGSFGIRWQTNAMAVAAGAASPQQQSVIWHNVLAHVGEPGAVITPYYGYYVLAAMAQTGHTREALDWMRVYWGGMIGEGATSFWEAYDPHWPKQDFHAFLEADNKRGYYVSLAHGWSSGPAAWLMEQVLGIEPTAAGFQEVALHPQLAGLDFARGAEPTPRGLLRVDLTRSRLTVALPPGTRASLALPFATDTSRILLDGHAVSLARDTAQHFVLDRSGIYTFEAQP